MDKDKLVEILVKRHDFSLERIEKQLDKFKEVKKESAQKKLF
jgi:hypothetical protein